LGENYSKSIQESRHNDNGKKSIVFLSVILIVALIIRLYYVPYGLPITLDGFTGYFSYALDISILRDFPNYSPSQSGWGEFLSLFFMNFRSDNFIDYMDLQRTISVILSAITVIPIYFICKKFFNNYYSLIGALIFAFEPRIIINSTLGISEPLYILAISLGILFFLSSNKKWIYCSFSFFAWATIIRPEGLFWFLGFSIIYFVQFRKKSKDLLKYIIPLLIFLLILSPFVYHRIQVEETDAIIGRIIIELSNYDNNQLKTDGDNLVSYGPNWFSGIKLFGWTLIPIFIIFIPIGLIPIFRHFHYPNYLLIISSLIISMPILYSTSIAPDTRYVLALFPIFCIISVFGIKWICDNFLNKKIISLIIVIGIMSSSSIFLDIKKIDFSEDKEAYQISQIIINDIKGVNEGPSLIKYLSIVELENKWPIKETSGEYEKKYDIKTISTSEYDTLEELLIAEESNITHLIVDKNQNNPQYILDLLNNEKKYSFLLKEFDSKEFNYNYMAKVYKIDYNIFKEIKKYE
tara:strand:+ start:95 stop:1657 length:1563 start_codon:yes stop_codon:yes gene_type:complete